MVNELNTGAYAYECDRTALSYEEFDAFIRKVASDFEPPLFSRIDVKEYYAKLQQYAKQVVCRHRGEVVGILCFYDNDEVSRRGYVTLAAVHSAYRGQGIATRLFLEGEREAARNGMKTMALHTSSIKARDLYLRNGYQTISDTQVTEDGVIRYYMEKALPLQPLNILLTSAGRRTYLVHYFKEALSGKGLVHASNSVMTYTLSQADRHVLTPAIYDEGYIDFLLEYCIRESISAIISLFDIDLPVLAANRDRFAASGIRLIISSEEVTAICNDKWKTYCFLRDIGMPQARTYLSLQEAIAAIGEGWLTYPLILKPRWGMGSIGIYQADNQEELEVFYKKIRKDIFKTYLRFESRENADACVMIQEKIKGQEYGLDVLNDLSGNYVTTIAKKKIAMRAGETDIAEIVDSTIFAPIGKKLSTTLGHVANLDVDCFLAEDGTIYVLELNCRFGGQYPFSHNAGVNFPKQIVAWLEGKGTDMNLCTPDIGTVSAKELTPVIISRYG